MLLALGWNCSQWVKVRIIFSQKTPAASRSGHPLAIAPDPVEGWVKYLGRPHSKDDSNFCLFYALKCQEYLECQGFRQVNSLDWEFGRIEGNER